MHDIQKHVKKKGAPVATPLNNSVVRAFDILTLISKAQPEISTADVSERLGLNASTAHRFLMTLEVIGALRPTKRGYFALGTKINQLGRVAEVTDMLPGQLQPHIDELSAQLEESVMVCRLSRHGPTCVAVAKSSRPISVNIEVGTLLPLGTTAQGKLWLAEMSASERNARLKAQQILSGQVEDLNSSALEKSLQDIKADGFASNLGENEPDIAAISVPVRDSANQIALTLSTFGTLGRFDEDFLTKARPALMATAIDLSSLLIGN